AAQCRVALAARDAQKLRASAERIARKGGQALAVACDVTRRDEVIRLGAAVRAAWGDAQVLVNCAGIARAARFTEMADELWDRTLETNLTGAYNCCQVFLPAMIESCWGRIINIASTAAKVGYPHVAAYTSSKPGLRRRRAHARERAPDGGENRQNDAGDSAFVRRQRAAESPDRARRSGRARGFPRGGKTRRHDRPGDQRRWRRGDGLGVRGSRFGSRVRSTRG